MTVINMEDLDLKDKRVLIRVDFNVPIQDGKITSDSRIVAGLPTIQSALDKGAAVILLSHRGRPTEGEDNPNLSLAPIAEHLSTLLKQPVTLNQQWLNGVDILPGQVVLCENVRFNQGEKSNDEDLAKKMAKLCDIFVMDAFATAHRAQASTHGVACFAPIACAGKLLMGELEALNNIFENPARPLTAIVGGAKVSTKLSVLHHLAQKVDHLIVGGGIANTFIVAAGNPVGKSLYEPDLVEEARSIIIEARENNLEIPIPCDVVVADSFSKQANATVKPISEVGPDDMILDIGPDTIGQYQALLKNSSTIIWNGPVGVFEFDQFATGTLALTKTIAESKAFSAAGGGDTIAAIEKYGVQDKISYISTGGGAFLEFLEGKTLPAIEVLEQRGNELA